MIIYGKLQKVVGVDTDVAGRQVFASAGCHVYLIHIVEFTGVLGHRGECSVWKVCFEVGGGGDGYLKQKLAPNGLLVITIGFHRVSGNFPLDSSYKS